MMASVPSRTWKPSGRWSVVVDDRDRPWVLTSWSLRKRFLLISTLATTTALAFLLYAAGPALTRLPRVILLVAALFALPAVLGLVGVRLAGPYIGFLVGCGTSVAVTFATLEMREESSTRGLALLWIPYLSVPVALISMLVETTCRAVINRRDSMAR